MGEFTPVIAGYGFIAVLLAALVLFPRTWWAHELARRYGVTPSGPFGIYTRRDHVKRAGLSVLASATCLGLALAAFAVAERIPDNRPGDSVALAYFFSCFLLAWVGALAALEALWRAVFYRPQLPPRPFDPSLWLGAAEVLEGLAIGRLPEGAWARFAQTPYADPALERVRVSCVRACRGEPARFAGPLRRTALEWAATLRAQAI